MERLIDRMGGLAEAAAALHARVFGALEAAALEGWFLGLAARLVFAAVLFGYYWGSALTKIGAGWSGVFAIQNGAYMQIAPQAMEAHGYDASALPFFPWDVMVAAGTYAEFLLPALVVAGLLARVAALGMIAFVLVQSWVDITFHGVDVETIGALFDRTATSAIMDQRTLWVFPLVYLVVKGAGLVSLDALLRRLLLNDRERADAPLSRAA